MAGQRARGSSRPPVVVICTSPECGHQWTSRAARHANVRCPGCGRTVRVKRPDPGRAAAEAGTLPPVPSLEPPRASLPAAPVPGPPAPEADETWIYDASDAHVLAEWTPAGQLVTASAARVDYAAELAARHWEIRPHGTARCQLVHMKPHGWQYGAPPRECVGNAFCQIPGGWVCESCNDALRHPVTGL
jgi:hypothetical protein